MSDRKAVIKNADMSEEMQQDAVDCATQALEKYNIEKDIAAYIKKVCEKYSAKPRWPIHTCERFLIEVFEKYLLTLLVVVRDKLCFKVNQ